MLQSQYANTGFFLEHNSSRLREAWAKIPTHVDILVTHTPPYGTADEGDMTGASNPLQSSVHF